jgi:hypothetical protein
VRPRSVLGADCVLGAEFVAWRRIWHRDAVTPQHSTLLPKGVGLGGRVGERHYRRLVRRAFGDG